MRVVGEQHERGETGRADRVALRDGLRRVADGVERVGDVADFLRQLRHLGDAARVVGDRAEGVERDDHARHRQHARCGDGDAVELGELVRPPDRRTDREHRQRRGLHRHAEARDDVGRVARRRRRGHLLHGAEVRARVVLGDHDHGGRERQADQRGEIQVHRLLAHECRRDRVERDRGEHAGDDHALIERRHDLAGLRADEERAQDRRDDRDRAERERVEHRVLAERSGGQAAEQHRGDQRHGVGFEQVGCHAGAVADVVADVVGDDGRVARVVLGDAGFDLADEVGTDVRALREDAAAQAREDRDQRAAEGEADEGLENLFARPCPWFRARGSNRPRRARPKPTTRRPVTAPPRKAILSAGFKPPVAA